MRRDKRFVIRIFLILICLGLFSFTLYIGLANRQAAPKPLAPTDAPTAMPLTPGTPPPPVSVAPTEAATSSIAVPLTNQPTMYSLQTAIEAPYASKSIKLLWNAYLDFESGNTTTRPNIVPYDLDCMPHYPNHGDYPNNVAFGKCGTNDWVKSCKQMGKEKDKAFIWFDTSSQNRPNLIMQKRNESNVICAHPNVYIAAANHYVRDRRKYLDIPIPYITYPYDGFPKKIDENEIRCDSATITASFMGQLHSPNSYERWELRKTFASSNDPKFIVEHRTGVSADKMYDTLRKSLFGFVPSGEGVQSFRLFEVMAMGVVPILMSDDWSLPFEDILNWDEFSIRVNFANISNVQKIIEEYKPRACEMSQRVFEVYRQYMSSPIAIARGIYDSIALHKASKRPKSNCA